MLSKKIIFFSARVATKNAFKNTNERLIIPQTFPGGRAVPYIESTTKKCVYRCPYERNKSKLIRQRSQTFISQSMNDSNHLTVPIFLEWQTHCSSNIKQNLTFIFLWNHSKDSTKYHLHFAHTAHSDVYTSMTTLRSTVYGPCDRSSNTLNSFSFDKWKCSLSKCFK